MQDMMTVQFMIITGKKSFWFLLFKVKCPKADPQKAVPKADIFK